MYGNFNLDSTVHGFIVFQLRRGERKNKENDFKEELEKEAEKIENYPYYDKVHFMRL